MDDIMKIVKSLQKLGILIKGVSKTIENQAKKQKSRFFSMSLGTLSASLLEITLAGKGVTWAGEGVIAANQGQGTITAGQVFYYYLILQLILKHKNNIKINLNLWVFIQEIIYLHVKDRAYESNPHINQ